MNLNEQNWQVYLLFPLELKGNLRQNETITRGTSCLGQLEQCLQLGPEFRTLVQIRTFLAKLVRIWSGILSKVRIFQKIVKIMHEIGLFWSLLNDSGQIE